MVHGQRHLQRKVRRLRHLRALQSARQHGHGFRQHGTSHSYRTDSSGYADVYLHAVAGDTVKVTVGAASCATTA